MRGVPSGIEVVRHVPQHLVEGYRNGTIRLWGGDLRRFDGTIAGFLTEGSDLVRQLRQGTPIQPVQLLQAVGDAKMAAQIASGIGMLNLGVQVAGFAMIRRHLDGIAQQVGTVRAELEAVGHVVGWLEMAKLAELRADAGNALADAERAARQGECPLFQTARSRADHARRKLVELLREMDRKGRLVAQHRLFRELMGMAILLAAVEARCDKAVEGPAQAAADLAATVADLRQLSDRFAAVATDFRAAPRDHLRLGEAGRAELLDGVRRVGSVLGRLRGHATKFRLQALLALDDDGWEELTMPTDATLACLTFVGDDGAALARQLEALDAEPAASRV